MDEEIVRWGRERLQEMIRGLNARKGVQAMEVGDAMMSLTGQDEVIVGMLLHFPSSARAEEPPPALNFALRPQLSHGVQWGWTILGVDAGN